jgi:hypothetical protein
MRIWLGNKLGVDTVLAARVLVGLALAELITFGAGTQYPVLLGMGRLKVLVVTAVPAGMLYIASSLLLVGHTRLGVYGVVVPNFVLSLLTRLVIGAHAAKLCGLRSRDYLALSYIRPFIVFVALLAFSLILNAVAAPSSYLVLGLCGFAAFFVWVGLCWFVGFSSKDRRRTVEIMRHGLSLLKKSATATAEAPMRPASGGV